MKVYQPRPGRVVQAYRFALDPNAGQQAALRSHCGAARASYNWAVRWITASWSQRSAELSYGIAEPQLTPWRSWSVPSLRKAFNLVKREDPRFSSWWAENSKEAYNTGFANAAAAFDSYVKSKRVESRRSGIPRLKSKHHAPMACRFTTGAIRVDTDRRHVTLPRLGTVRTHESTRKLQRRIANGTARIMSATVRYERGRWWVAFQVEVEREPRVAERADAIVGVDLGVRNLAVLADSRGRVRVVPNPRHYDTALVRLRKLSRRVSRRRGPDRRRGVEPSNRWRKANAERNRVHHRVANARADALHKLTTSIRAEYGTVIVEDLHVTGMLRNRRLARRIADAGFGRIRHQLTYKGEWCGGRTVVADRWYPSSKTCSTCGAVKAKLRPGCRVFTCECGLVMDRDENAARNLAALAAAHSTTGTGVAGDRGAPAPKPRGVDRKTRNGRLGTPAERSRAGDAIRSSGQKRETVIRTPPAPSDSGDTVTDLPRSKGWNADIHKGNR
ncbi:IS607 family element RNA-guided endonuclease TnpB [Nocardia otitidiscaviarum]|uniref:IS607 family element RNA-guided endonuclease TnpB n=1 Tax=Nocardia otitidiscaviarum TaxID=1823 RepID=UPI001C8F3907|nr:IS607 family element RNA-guided endonuclease TnpB [Nocardia otitidiscaviarum]MCP9620080.1 IS607 family element RNA-guided endonuclease TnpB [Nocardia otitidiscaviarum]